MCETICTNGCKYCTYYTCKYIHTVCVNCMLAYVQNKCKLQTLYAPLSASSLQLHLQYIIPWAFVLPVATGRPDHIRQTIGNMFMVINLFQHSILSQYWHYKCTCGCHCVHMCTVFPLVCMNFLHSLYIHVFTLSHVYSQNMRAYQAAG